MPIHNPTSVHKSGSAALFGDITLSQGTNVTLTQTGNDISIAASGGAGGSATEVEVDFGSGVPAYEASFTITDGSVSGSSKIVVSQSGNVATSRVGNDAEWDSVIYAALAGTGQFTLYARALPGPLVGKRKLFYSIY